MSPDDVLSIFSEGLWLAVMLVSVIILPSLGVGLVVSVFQAATQINEQTLSFLPRLLVTLMTLVAAGPWLLMQIMDYAQDLYRSVPFVLG